ncbi:hypothetical protein [Comamonas sp. JUb58]|uniref:hypothetical protein n=1 Tax=Comamonas sp. JUb58 TaxID=2485114 RepID=UPI00105F86FB|nr:hypothetical protein [Comamonas sp. JUb58]TDS73389.1 hypothetical protein EDF71_12163 [Comamonas sp. JUb58]
MSNQQQNGGLVIVALDTPAPEPAILPAVVITGITVDEVNAARAVIAPDFRTMKLPVGSAVTIDVELQWQGQRVPGFGEEFAMPMRSTDGLMRHIDIKFVDGSAQFVAAMNDSKRWEVTPRANQQRPAARSPYGLRWHRHHCRRVTLY